MSGSETNNDSDLLIRRIVDDINEMQTNIRQQSQTLDKLTNVSADVAKLLAVIDLRINQQEKVASTIGEVLERRRDERERDNRDADVKLTNVKNEMIAVFRDEFKKFEEDRKEHAKASEKRLDDLDKRVAKAEKWMYIVTGGGVLVAFVINHIAPLVLKAG